MRISRRSFLPVGLAVAVASALAYPPPAAALCDLGLVPWLVAAIFLVNGYTLRLQSVRFGRSFARTALVALLLGLVLSPLIGVAFAKALPLGPQPALGLIIMSTVPPTLSSAIVVTGVAGGNAAWALCLTVGLNLAGVLTVPFMLGLCLRLEGSISISPAALFFKLILLLLVPLLAGYGLQRLGDRGTRSALVAYLPSACIILTVWMSLAKARDNVLSLDVPQLALIATASMAVHTCLLILAAFAGKLLGLDGPERTALLFTASQKTLPVALTVLAALNVVGPAVIVCLLFHLLQLLLDFGIAARARPATASSA